MARPDRRRRLKSWSKNYYFSDEIWREILRWLPVKALLQFRCASTTWRAMIEDPSFARLHLTSFNKIKSYENLLVPYDGTYGEGAGHVKCFVRRSSDFGIITTLGYLESDRSSIGTLEKLIPYADNVQRWIILGSIDGLFVLQGEIFWDTIMIMLWNPSIRKTRFLPPSPRIRNERTTYTDLGLGFEPLSNDYKLVRFVKDMAYLVHFVAVYTLSTDSWKTIELRGKGSDVMDPYICLTSWCNHVVSITGVLYTLVRNHYDGPLSLVSFDLSNELFASNSLPTMDYLEAFCHRDLTLCDGGSSLALIDLWENKGSIWVSKGLEDDGKYSSWTKRYTFAIMNPEDNAYMRSGMSRRFVYLNENGEIWLTRRMVIAYNIETGEERVLMKKGSSICRGWLYNESLIMLKMFIRDV